MADTADRDVPLRRSAFNSPRDPFDDLDYSSHRNAPWVPDPPMSSQQQHAQFEARRQSQFAAAQDYIRPHKKTDDPSARYRMSDDRLEAFREEDRGHDEERKVAPFGTGVMRDDEKDSPYLYSSQFGRPQGWPPPPVPQPEPQKPIIRPPGGSLARRVTVDDTSDEDGHKHDLFNACIINHGGNVTPEEPETTITGNHEPGGTTGLPTGIPDEVKTAKCKALVKYDAWLALSGGSATCTEEMRDEDVRESRDNKHEDDEDQNEVDMDFLPNQRSKEQEIIPAELWKPKDPKEPSLADGIRNGTWFPLYVRVTGMLISFTGY
jgi:hypothetical protein